ncbi:hypothetical protein [Actinacidiphila bryophytorum]|uniref:Uncharacterized protein n=1 Tax=Actinacidiphila bryophytorum TaxID=1436133 RepID=A0A9W4H2M3_9ACTN|nr:hypothetical protein [Actinacidiphila bryophytorum]MBM9440309.1 hypothetical protein [Actinacidiphila bryophytorum]MBN6545071.1 hypothetical protein [Actinacidiphila bryophytorum]CAG7645648.1 conserved exported hypothetical protein [Actinacidiphila bryophytorum]
MTVSTRQWGKRAAAVAGMAAAVVLTGCSSGSGTGSLSESGLHDKVRTAAKEGTHCPLDYDLDKAASAAHVPGPARPVSASVSLPEDADDGAVLRTAQATDVECDYRVGPEAVSVETLAAQKGTASNLLAPLIQRNAQMSTTQLRTYLALVHKAPTGTPVATPSGNVALVRLPGAGGDSVALMLSCGTGQDSQQTKLTTGQVNDLADHLASQAHW